jgi:arsenite/tail-anchored protein-transporting ATPase
MQLPRLIFVTGKGGTGKSTVAVALATAISRRGPVTIADLERRRTVARILGVSLNGAGHLSVGHNLDLTALTPRHELEAFIEGIVPLKAISRRMLRSRTFGYVTAALPGLEAFLTVERMRLMAGEAALEDGYAVIDAPSTGNAIELLSVARGVRRIAPRGTLNRLAETVEEFLVDPNRFGVVLTVRPEELALREALEARSELHNLGIRCIATVLNGVADSMFTKAEIAKAQGLGDTTRLAERRREIADDAARTRRALKAAGLTVIELPLLFTEAVGRDQVGVLADSLSCEPLLR